MGGSAEHLQRKHLVTDLGVFSFAIKIVSSLLLIFLRLAFLGGTPTRIPMLTTPTSGTLTIIPPLTTDKVMITGIGTLWPCQCNRNLPSAAITMALWTG